MPAEDPQLKVTEHIVLNKYEGDDSNSEPVETITIENDVVIQHTKNGKVVFDAEKKIDPRPANERGNPYRPNPQEK